MPTSKREREYARKRHEKWLAHVAQVQARRRRTRRIVAGLLLGGLALSAVVVAVVQANRSDEVPAITSDGETTPSVDPTITLAAPDPALAEGRTWTAQVTTSVGDLTLELDGAAAPQAVASFLQLAQQGFFDGTTCHRLTLAELSGISVLQCGDPTGTGTGGPGYSFGPIENAPADDVYPAGTLAMARTSDDGASMGSQFFLVHADSTIPADSAGGYTVFGRVVEGMDVLEAVVAAGVVEGTQDTPVTAVTIEAVEAQ